ncbi:GFA family protein [Microbulbifer taiwanensis]|uniref:GFA family protein n=1 Tax=Microbulbifer taiwanensis TaxID=986746 RepID=A0ABW1YN40_9GAMM|nr:GFA family protein [Microbulbifer taiwanensis]
MRQTYKGSCHCGGIRFEADLDMSAGTGKCNCSICSKARYWGAIVPPQDFRLIQGEEFLGDYQFGNRVNHHYFCKRCGTRTFGRGFVEEIGGDYVSVNVAALDDVDLQQLIEAPVRYFDGRNNNWQSEPEETRHL